MDNIDRANLKFLLSLETQEDWDNWGACADPDDLEYAMYLLKTGLAENEVLQMELAEAADEELGLDLSQARDVLSRF